MTISVRNKMLITILGYLAMLVVISIFIIIPSIRKIRTISQDVYEQQIYLEKLYMRGQLVKRVRRQLAEINPFIEKLAQGFIDPDQSVEFILNLENLAKNNNLDQRIDMSPEQKIQKNVYEILPVRLSLEGRFIDFVKYLKGLEEMDYYFNVKSLSVGRPTSKYTRGVAQTDTRLNILLQGQSYWLR